MSGIGSASVLRGDARALPLPDASVNAILTDPPYGLEFMGKDWDAPWRTGDGFRRSRNTADAGRDDPFGRASRTSPENIAGRGFQEWCEQWTLEALRVLKPGGHLLAFGGTRTWHRLTCAIEDAGFEIRDSMAWLYGSGFPKSLDVAKAIDKAGGASPEVQGRVLREARERAGLTREDVAAAIGCSARTVHGWEDGRARAAGRAVEYLTPASEFRAKLADLLGYTADERAVVGLDDDRREDGTVYGFGHTGVLYGQPSTEAARQWSGWGTALKPGYEPIVVARKPLAGTVAANVLAYGTGALNIDACRVGDGERTNHAGGASSLQRVSRVQHGYRETVTASVGEAAIVTGRWPTNVALDEEAAAELDEQSGMLTSGANPTRRSSDKFRNAYGEFQGQRECIPARGADEGGASRFFPTFRYEAKAPTAERPVVDGVAHPTVKPLDLMRWLVRLVTEPGGLILDPFAGSGTTLEAAMLEGFRAVGVEQDPQYLPLIQHRIGRARRQAQPGVSRLAASKPREEFDGQLDILAELGGVA